jgi:hypothetical protein
MDERYELLHATTTHTTTAARLECSPWWLNSSDQPEICPKQCALTSNTLSVSVRLKIDPLLICTNLEWDPLGGCAPPLANCCTLVIPPSESGCMCLKLSALVSSVMGRKGFPGSGPVNSLEPWICLPKCCALTGQLLRPR